MNRIIDCNYKSDNFSVLDLECEQFERSISNTLRSTSGNFIVSIGGHSDSWVATVTRSSCHILLLIWSNLLDRSHLLIGIPLRNRLNVYNWNNACFDKAFLSEILFRELVKSVYQVGAVGGKREVEQHEHCCSHRSKYVCPGVSEEYKVEDKRAHSEEVVSFPHGLVMVLARHNARKHYFHDC